LSGPALHQRDSHHSIHLAANGEAEELTGLLRECFRHGEPQRALELALLLVEHWETRTIRHAQAEEEGFYLECLDRRPSLREVIVTLKRDHDLMRILLKEIKEELSDQAFNESILARFDAMLLINQIHGREEERMLLEQSPEEREDEES